MSKKKIVGVVALGVIGWVAWRALQQQPATGGIDFKMPVYPTPLQGKPWEDPFTGTIDLRGWGIPGVDEMMHWMYGTSPYDTASAGGAQVVTKKWKTPAVGEYAPDANGNPERVVYDGRQWDRNFAAAESRYGIPGGVLSRLAWQESRYNPDSMSGKGAVGMMQIVPAVWGKIIPVEEMKNPVTAIPWAAYILADNYKNLRDWPQAIVAYNQGWPAVKKMVQQHGENWLLAMAPNSDGRKYFQVAVDVGLVPVAIAQPAPAGVA